jgi:transposase InsO family protein
MTGSASCITPTARQPIRQPGVSAGAAQHGILSSMSRRGNCWDNAVAESFFASLKIELVDQTR